MNNRVLAIAVALALVLAACAPQATPTVNPLDVQNTAVAAAATMVVQTQMAIPTNTLVPPTATESPTAVATLTSIPSTISNSDSLLLPSPTGVPTLIPQQPTASSGGGTTADDCNKPLTDWDVPTIELGVVNETKPQGNIVLSLYVVTSLGECGYLTDLSQGPVGSYSAGAFVDGKKSFKVFGGFLLNEGSWDIVVRNDKIVAAGGCYPHC